MADVFEDWRSRPVVGSNNEPVRKRADGSWITDGTGGVFRDDFPITLNDVRARLFRLIDDTPALDWLLLTKRPENVGRMMPEYFRTSPSINTFFGEEADRRGVPRGESIKSTVSVGGIGVFRPNVWLGTSVENQSAADERIPHLLKVPAAVRFLSVEPLLGPVDLTSILFKHPDREHPYTVDPLRGVTPYRPDLPLPGGIHWCIVGGESGPNARPCRVEWIRDVVRQCKAAGVPVFVKQLGGDYQDALNGVCGRSTKWPLDVLPSGPAHRLDDPKGGDPAEWPDDLRVREWPEVRA
jgi:protein gp37